MDVARTIQKFAITRMRMLAWSPSRNRLRAAVTAIVALAGISASQIAADTHGDGSNPNQAETFSIVHDRAAAALLAGRLDEALTGFNHAIALNARSPLAYYNRGSVYYAKRQFEQAIEDFSKAIELNPAFAYAHMNRGISHSNLGRLDQALADINEAVKLDKTGSDALFNRAIVHARRNDIPSALQDYQAAIARDAQDIDAIAARDRLLRLLGAGAKTDISTVIDSSRIAAEIEHARLVEHILRLAENSCLRHGNSESGLAVVARREQWQAASPEALEKASVATARMVGGWTFADRFGAYAVMQSFGTDDRRLVVCSLSTKLASAHIMDDVKAGFEDRFRTAPHHTIERPEQTTTRYQLPSFAAVKVDGALVFGARSMALTMRFLFKPNQGALP